MASDYISCKLKSYKLLAFVKSATSSTLSSKEVAVWTGHFMVANQLAMAMVKGVVHYYDITWCLQNIFKIFKIYIFNFKSYWIWREDDNLQEYVTLSFKVNMPSWPFCCELPCNSVHKVSSPIKPNVEITAAHDYYVAGVGRRRGVTTARLWADWRRPADTAGPHQPCHAPGSETVQYPGNGFFVTAFAISKY